MRLPGIPVRRTRPAEAAPDGAAPPGHAIAVPRLTERPDHLLHGDGGTVSRTYAVSNWPGAVHWGFWTPLLRLRDAGGRRLSVRVALQATPYATTFWSDEEKYHVRRLRAEASEQRRLGASWRANELEATAASLEALKNREVMEGVATFDVTALVTVTAPNLPALEGDCAQVVEWAQARGITLAAEPRTQLPSFMAGFASASPAAADALHRRIMDEDCLAALIPAQDGPWGGRGVYAGVRVSDGAFVTLPLDDPNMETGNNFVVLGMTGSGKSFYVKALLTGLLMSGYRVVVFDVNGEFRAWCEAMGGVWVDHTPGSGRYTEPMRIARRPGGYEEMVRRVEAVVSLLAGGLDAVGENVVDKVTTLTCQRAGVAQDDPETWSRPLRLRQWYVTLAALAGWQVTGDGAAEHRRSTETEAPGTRVESAEPQRVGSPDVPAPLSPSARGGDEAPTAANVSSTVAGTPGTLEEAVLRHVHVHPVAGERGIAAALVGGYPEATRGRVYRILQRHDLLTAEKRRALVREAGEPASAAPAVPSRPAPVETREEGTQQAGGGTEGRRSAAGARPDLPTLPDALQATALNLAARLEPYFAGGLRYVFGADDTVDFSAPLVVIHAADAADAEDRLAALKMVLDGAAVREMLEEERKAARRYTTVFFDEGQRLLQNAHMRRYASDLFTAIRQRNGMAMLATNSTQTLFEVRGGVTQAGPIWQNARGKVFLAMSREAVEDVRQHGQVPAQLVRLIEGLRAPDHLVVLEWDGRYEVVRMEVPPEEAALYRTRGLRRDAASPTDE